MPESQERNDGFFIARGQAPVLLEAAEKALDFVAVTIGFFVERDRFHSVGVARNNGFDVVLDTIGPVFVTVISRVGQYLARLQAGQQGLGLRAIPGLPAGGNQAYGVAQGLGAGVNLGADAPATAAEALGFGVTFFWPAECWWARTTVESSITQSNSGACKAKKARSHTPFWARRRKRRQTELVLPKRSGRSAQGQPVRIIQIIALKNNRLSLAVTPQSVALPGKSGDTASHWRSVIS